MDLGYRILARRKLKDGVIIRKHWRNILTVSVPAFSSVWLSATAMTTWNRKLMVMT